MRQTNSTGSPISPPDTPSENRDDLLFNIQFLYPKMPKSFKKITDYLLRFPEDASRLSITQLAQRAGTTPSNITRYCQSLGYGGFAEFKYRFELSHKGLNKDTLVFSKDDSVDEIKQKFLKAAIQTLDPSLMRINSRLFEYAAGAILKANASGNRICIFGSGGSAYSAQFAELFLIQAGVSCAAYTNLQIAKTVATQLGPGDIALCLSSSGNAVLTVDCMEKAKQHRATIISITCNQNSMLDKKADISINYVSDIKNDIRMFPLLKLSELTVVGMLSLCIMLRNSRDNLEELLSYRDSFFDDSHVY